VTYFDADSVDRNDRLRVLCGRYDDEFVKENGRWFIKNRYVTAYYRYTAGDTHKFTG
jgi:hypothetical protein